MGDLMVTDEPLTSGQILHIRARFITETPDGLLIEAGSAFGVRALCVAPEDVVQRGPAVIEVGDQVRWTRDPAQSPNEAATRYRVCGVDGVFAWIKPDEISASTGVSAMGQSVPIDELAYLGRLFGPRSPYEAVNIRRSAS